MPSDGKRHQISVGSTAYGILNHIMTSLPGLDGVKSYDDVILWVLRNVDYDDKIKERVKAAENVLTLRETTAHLRTRGVPVVPVETQGSMEGNPSVNSS